MPVNTTAFRAECEALDRLLAGLGEDDWSRATSFYGWTVADEVMHLLQVDGFGQVALDAPENFPELVRWVREGQERGIELSQRMRESWAALSPAALLDEWRSGWARLADGLDAADPDRKLPWFGPAIRAQSFANARQMEVWAHGQDICDLFAIERRTEDRIRTICDLGVRTHGFAFDLHGMARPSPPEVMLVAPGGEIWTWNEGQPERVEGTAADFALLVTHRRRAADTDIVFAGEGARAWLSIAQCFAGRPRDWEGGPCRDVHRAVRRRRPGGRLNNKHEQETGEEPS